MCAMTPVPQSFMAARGNENMFPQLQPRGRYGSFSALSAPVYGTLQRCGSSEMQTARSLDSVVVNRKQVDKLGNTFKAAKRAEVVAPPSVNCIELPAAPKPHHRLLAFPTRCVARLPSPLPNLGNTCYMNSVMQCLRQSPALFTALERVQPKAATHPAATALLDFHKLTEGDPQELLMTFKTEAAKYNDEFKEFTQADAHEFLRTIILVVHNEINRVLRSFVSEEPLDSVGKEDEATSFWRWREQFSRFDNSAIYDLFGGATLASTTCKSCKNASLTFEAFLDLSLPIAQGAPHGVNVEDVLRDNFVDTKGEKMEGSNRIFCPSCRRLRKGVRRVVVKQWPKLLVLHLKRFDEYGRKNLASVIYPDSFMTGGENSLRYKLYGVLMHQGTELWGHYISYVRVGLGEWYLCNDATITPTKPVDVMQELESAYILFYAEVP